MEGVLTKCTNPNVFYQFGINSPVDHKKRYCVDGGDGERGPDVGGSVWKLEEFESRAFQRFL